ncbi:MAG: LPS export ABC transporter periplasmic protein LptC [Pseudomonadota bacterium]
MATDANFHTWLVGWLKILLPIGALALLSTLFLFARNPANQTQEIPIAQIEAIAQEQQITAPQFSGLTDDGSIVAVQAVEAKPQADNPDTLLVERLTIDLDTPEGTKLNITSGTSELNTVDQTARLNGLSRVITSTGYTMETNGLTADLKTGEIVSDGELAIQAPFGDVTAGKVRIHVTADGTGQQMVFTQGVRLVYTPGQDSP